MTFGEKVKNLRKNKGLSQTQLADAVGVSLRTVRSMDRASNIYESMTLRGYTGDFHYINEKVCWKPQDFVYFFLWLSIILLFRRFPMLVIIGQAIGHLF